jgi:hypothetical protein
MTVGEQEPGQLGRGLGREQFDRLGAVHDDGPGQVVLQVRADTHQLVTRLDASEMQSGPEVPYTPPALLPTRRSARWKYASTSS